MLNTYHGRCYCGAVRFQAELDLTQGTTRCNCTFCRKTRNWSARTTPEHVRLTHGVESLARHEVGPHNGHGFCATCGVRMFSSGDIPELGGAFVTVSIAVLEDATEAELIAAPVIWCDGLNDNWWSPPAEVRHL